MRLPCFKHHYSVPKEYIGKRVDIVYDAETLEIFHGLRHVATHHRDDTPYGYTQKARTTCPAFTESLSSTFAEAATPDSFLNWLLSREWDYRSEAAIQRLIRELDRN